jgi:murein DD-endopeptidase MepM/ murein hydrolase activator NlpD
MKRYYPWVASLGLAVSLAWPGLALAVDLTDIEQEIANRKSAIETINRQLEEYRKKVQEYAGKADSLQNEVALVENELAILELDIAATRTQIEENQLQVQALDERITLADEELARRKVILRNLLFALHSQREVNSPALAMLRAENFAEGFRTAAQLQSVNEEIRKALAATQTLRQNLERDRANREQILSGLVDMETSLTRKVAALEAQRIAKEVLLKQTANSEDEYRSLLSELRREQQGISSRISELQREVDRRLANRDPGGEGDSLPPSSLSWPVRGIITTTFHDPTYPFRHLFEHSGFDIAVAQGTPIIAPAPGVVAWAKTGRMYGNYVMVIHSGGLATLYAHMSRIDVAPDQYVERGQVVGLSGGRPGTPGAGFSTGPHVHFEVRSNGIPVDPANYLP